MKIDDEKCWSKMPTFEAQNIARFPIIPVEDFETFVMAQKLEMMNLRLMK